MEEKKQGKIRLLKETTINQIAAGEVIENVSSVIKELIENAVDANANEICIETIGAGRGLIVVKDNGCGIDREDLPLAIERHATSKIVESEDLFRLSTLGFRGEALASISSVSKLKIHSSTSESKGHLLSVEGGKTLFLNELPRNQGTTVEVASLFYNTPARKKFQKSVGAERADIHKTLVLSALCYPTITFEWINEGKREMFLKGGLPRLEPLLGRDFSSNGSPVSCVQGEYELEGILVRPPIHRPNRMMQYLFVNSRPVYSPLISSFVESAYATRLPTHRFPLFMLHLKIPSDEIDVNVHPRKKEVRFHDEKKIESLLHYAVKLGLEEPKESLPKFTLPPPQAFSLDKQEIVERKEENLIQREPVRVLTLLGEYLLVKESEEEILVVDTRRARRRVFYERLGQDKTLPCQKLLFPLTIERPFMSEEQLELMNRFGIAIRHFGGRSYLIEAFPEIFNEEEIIDLIDQFTTEVMNVESKAKIIFIKQIKKKVLTIEEGARLVEELFRCDEPHLCPELKPIYKRLNPKEVAKWL